MVSELRTFISKETLFLKQFKTAQDWGGDDSDGTNFSWRTFASQSRPVHLRLMKQNICLYLSRVSLIGCYRCSIIRPKGHIVLLSLTEYICTSSQYDTDDHSIFNKPDNKSYEEAMIGWLSSQQEHQSPHLCLPSPHPKYLPPTLARVINKLSWVVHLRGNMSILNCASAHQTSARLQTSLISQNWSPVSQ